MSFMYCNKAMCSIYKDFFFTLTVSKYKYFCRFFRHINGKRSYVQYETERYFYRMCFNGTFLFTKSRCRISIFAKDFPAFTCEKFSRISHHLHKNSKFCELSPKKIRKKQCKQSYKLYAFKILTVCGG